MGSMRPLPKPAVSAAVGAGAAVTGYYGVLVGESLLARRAIGMTEERPPSADGVYGDDLPGRPIRCLVLGDSALVGYGMTTADATPPALIGIGLAHVLDTPVDVHSEAVVGAQTEDLREQVNRGLTYKPDIAVIVIGTNDVTHQLVGSGTRPRAARRRRAPARRRRLRGRRRHVSRPRHRPPDPAAVALGGPPAQPGARAHAR